MNSNKLFFDIQNKLENSILKTQDRIIKVYAQAYQEIIAKIKTIYSGYVKNGSLSNTDKATLNRLLSIEKECVKVIKTAHKEVEELVSKRASFSYGESFFRHAYYIDEAYSLNLDWGVVPKNAVEIAALDDFSLLAKSKTFNDALNPSVNTLREIFSTSLIEGKSYESIRDQLIKKLGVSKISSNAARFVGGGVASWAMMVARTETHRAISMGFLKTEEKCRENNLEIDFYWCATLDGKTRPEHGALDGKMKDAEKGGWYVPSIGYVAGPGLSGRASFDINCRCCVIPRPRSIGLSDVRRIKGEGIQPYKTYTDWKKGLKTQGVYEGDNKRGISRRSYLVIKAL